MDKFLTRLMVKSNKDMAQLATNKDFGGIVFKIGICVC
jgi:hypothetical protein